MLEDDALLVTDVRLDEAPQRSEHRWGRRSRGSELAREATDFGVVFEEWDDVELRVDERGDEDLFFGAKVRLHARGEKLEKLDRGSSPGHRVGVRCRPSQPPRMNERMMMLARKGRQRGGALESPTMRL